MQEMSQPDNILSQKNINRIEGKNEGKEARGGKGEVFDKINGNHEEAYERIMDWFHDKNIMAGHPEKLKEELAF